MQIIEAKNLRSLGIISLGLCKGAKAGMFCYLFALKTCKNYRKRDFLAGILLFCAGFL
jgi:hypothetical protein